MISSDVLMQIWCRSIGTCDMRQSVEDVLRLVDELQIEHVPNTNKGALYGINMLDPVK